MQLFIKLNSFLPKIAFSLFFYVLISLEQNTIGAKNLLIYTFVFLTFYIGIGIFGYIINDISDEKTDKLASKKNVTVNLSFIQKIIIVFSLLILGVVPISLYAPTTIPFIIFEILLLICYSFPPFRLKEKGVLGIIADSLYAYTVPSVILLTFLNSFFLVNSFFWYFLPLFSFMLGLKNILNHQLEDLDNDILSGVKTFVMKSPTKSMSLMINITLLSCVLWFIAIIVIYLTPDLTSIVLICFIVIGISFLLKTSYYLIFKEHKYLKDLPESDVVYWGILSLMIYGIINMEIRTIFLIVFFITPQFTERLLKIYWFIFKILFHTYWTIFKLLSRIINYSLYYSFLLVGVDLRKHSKQKKTENKKAVNSIVSSEKIAVTKIHEKNVHGLWIGNELSVMELLTIHSFIKHGYTFHLWSYESIKNTLPKSCICCDANEIIPKDRVFKYKYNSQYGTGKGSYAGFSDIFRYKLLYEKGGWWVDMDVTCLKPFDIDSPYFFRSHHELPMVGNIMKTPKGSELMLKCYREALESVNENNKDWHKPIEILIKNISEFNFQNYILPETSNTDEWHKIKNFVFSQTTIPVDWYFIHWCNEMWRTNGYSKNQVMYSSKYGQLLMEYKLIPKLEYSEMKKRDRFLRFKLLWDNFLTFV